MTSLSRAAVSSKEFKMESSSKRQIACKISIKEILASQYFQQEGWNPNYFLTPQNKKVSRVNVLAVVVALVDGPQKTILVDDGSGKITLKFFEPPKNLPAVGDPVLIIGRPREFNQEKFIVPEIIHKIKNPLWLEVRKKELNLENTLPDSQEKPVQDTGQENAPLENLFSLIKKLDQGSGVDVEKIIRQSNLDNTEELVEQMIKEGEIFEIEPGRIKLLK